MTHKTQFAQNPWINLCLASFQEPLCLAEPAIKYRAGFTPFRSMDDIRMDLFARRAQGHDEEFLAYRQSEQHIKSQPVSATSVIKAPYGMSLD